MLSNSEGKTGKQLNLLDSLATDGGHSNALGTLHFEWCEASHVVERVAFGTFCDFVSFEPKNDLRVVADFTKVAFSLATETLGFYVEK